MYGGYSKRLYAPAVIALVCIMVGGLSASGNERVQEECRATMPPIPLENSMGTEAYNQAMDSGKYRYVGNTKCRLCHRKFFIGRKKDPHDYALKRLETGGYEKNPRCLICHATGYGVPTGFVNRERTPRLANVQCEGCHGPGNIHIQLAKSKKPSGGFLAGEDHPERLKKMCQSCHTKRWNRSYHDLDKAYSKYRNPNPNARTYVKENR